MLTLNSGRVGFHPVKEFTSSKGYTTLFFVQQHGIAYDGYSDDPIFPARLRKPGRRGDWRDTWINNIPRANVLGCVSLAEICTPSRDKCIDAWKKFRPHSPEMVLLRFGMLSSTFGGYLGAHTGKILDAASRVMDELGSIPLRKDQWKFEVQRLFGMSLIRAKMEVLELAHGTRSKEPGFTNYLAHERGICTMVKFRAEGYKNLSLMGVIIATFAPPLIGLPVRRRPPIMWLGVGVCRFGKISNSLLRWIMPWVMNVLIHKPSKLLRMVGGWLREITR